MKANSRHVLALLGSNLQPHRHIQEAVALIGQQWPVEGMSRLFLTEPFGVPETQPWFLNLALVFRSDEDVNVLVTALKKLEKKVGRRDRGANQKILPREIDIDLLAWVGEGGLAEFKGGIALPPYAVLPGEEALRRAGISSGFEAANAPEDTVCVPLAELSAVLCAGSVIIPEQPTPSWIDRDLLADLCGEASELQERGAVPAIAAVTTGGNVISRARNEIAGLCDPTAHAEMLAIRSAAARLGRPYLEGSTLYATLEPCGMCTSAAIFSRLSHIVVAVPRASDNLTFFEYPSLSITDLCSMTTRVAPSVHFVQVDGCAG